MIYESINIDRKREGFREPRELAIEVTPPRLDESYLVVDVEVWYHFLQEILGRNVIRIEQGDKLASGPPQSGLKRTSLVTGSLFSMNHINQTRILGFKFPRNACSIVC